MARPDIHDSISDAAGEDPKEIEEMISDAIRDARPDIAKMISEELGEAERLMTPAPLIPQHSPLSRVRRSRTANTS